MSLFWVLHFPLLCWKLSCLVLFSLHNHTEHHNTPDSVSLSSVSLFWVSHFSLHSERRRAKCCYAEWSYAECCYVCVVFLNAMSKNLLKFSFIFRISGSKEGGHCYVKIILSYVKNFLDKVSLDKCQCSKTWHFLLCNLCLGLIS